MIDSILDLICRVLRFTPNLSLFLLSLAKVVTKSFARGTRGLETRSLAGGVVAQSIHEPF